MSDIAQPLFQNETPRSSTGCSRKVLAFSLLVMGLGCAVLWNQMPSTNAADQEATIEMPMKFMPSQFTQSAKNFQAMQRPALGIQSMRPSRSVWAPAESFADLGKPTSSADMGTTFHSTGKMPLAVRWDEDNLMFPGVSPKVQIKFSGVRFPITYEAQMSTGGTVSFYQPDPATCEITWKVSGLTPGQHGIQIHEKADGPLYNPFNKPPQDIAHMGTLGYIVADKNGNSEGMMRDGLVKLFGEYSLLGKSMQIHADLEGLGKPEAIGEIEITKSAKEKMETAEKAGKKGTTP